MNDKELLELAAKAAELDVVWVGDLPHIKSGEYFMYIWNPLTDDGDALRLAYQLEMVIDFMEGRVIAGQPRHEVIVDFDDDYRRAIVRAAAEIGKGIK